MLSTDEESREELVSQQFAGTYIEQNNQRSSSCCGPASVCICRVITLLCVLAINTGLLIFSLRNYECVLGDVQGMDLQQDDIVLLVGDSQTVGVNPMTISDGSGCKVLMQGFKLTPDDPTLATINEN